MDQGQKIDTLRKEKGLTQAELGAKLNVTFQAVSKWERGESYPDFATLSRLAKLFDVPIVYFEDNGEEIVKESAVSSQATQELANNFSNSTMVGVCKECGKVVYEGDVASKTPYILCKDCNTSILARKEKEALRLKEEREKVERKAKRNERLRIAEIKRTRNKVLIWSAVICGAIIILAIAGIIQDPTEIGETLMGLVI